MGDWACNRLDNWVVAAEPVAGWKARVFVSLSVVASLPFALLVPVEQDEGFEMVVAAVASG